MEENDWLLKGVPTTEELIRVATKKNVSFNSIKCIEKIDWKILKITCNPLHLNCVADLFFNIAIWKKRSKGTGKMC